MSASLFGLDEAVSSRIVRSLRERLDLLEDENRQLREAAEALVLFPKSWRLTKMETRFLSALMRARTGHLSREALLTAMYGLEPDVADNMISIWTCKVRKKLSDVGIGIEIETSWGQGYGLSSGGRILLETFIGSGSGPGDCRDASAIQAAIDELKIRLDALSAGRVRSDASPAAVLGDLVEERRRRFRPLAAAACRRVYDQGGRRDH